MSSVSTTKVIEQFQKELIDMGTWENRVFLSPDETFVPSIRQTPFACLVFGSLDRALETDDCSTSTWDFVVVQYVNLRTLNFAGTGRSGLLGLYDIWEALEAKFNRTTLNDLVDMVWFKRHEKLTPVGTIKGQEVEAELVRAVSRVKVEGFKEG